MMLKFVIGLLLPLASAVCLPNGIPASERRLLVNNQNGQTYPLGVWEAAYAASEAGNAIAAILIEEVFGLETTLGTGTGVVDGIHGVMPCKDPLNVTDRKCDDDGVAQFHVHIECWVEGYQTLWDDMQSLYPKSAPVNLGNMGFDGMSSDFLPRSVITQAKQSEGWALQYYSYYNASWRNPAKYFNDPATVNASAMLMPCSNSLMSDAATARGHVKFTGDLDGVVVDGNGDYVAMKCEGGAAGYWWLAPSCRSNISACIPWNTGGSGWGVSIGAQRAVLLNMPLALSVAKSWTEYTQFPFTHSKSTFFWWTPDPTFLELDPQLLVYPPYNWREWDQGILTSAASATSVDKIVSRDLVALAPNVQTFVERLTMTIDQMNDILLSQKQSGNSWRNVTCEWLLNNEATWRPWIPDESQCFAGFGLYDDDLNTFTDSRNTTNKIVCQACPAGTFSQPLTDSIGDTFICSACPAGTSQPSGASLSCKQCKPGEYQDQPGASSCNRCVIGLYQDESGATACKVCPAATTTLGPGSVGLSDCGCRKDEINMNEIGGFRCEACTEGMNCPDLSQLADLKDGESTLGDDYVPTIVQGYYATPLAPTEVYRCGSLAACPGGLPGTCGGGLVGLPCDKCAEGNTWNGSECVDCAGWRQALWGTAIVGIFAFLVLAYYLTTSKVTAKATVLFATTASFGMLVMSMQNLGLIGMMTVAWPENLTGLFSICRFLLLDIDSYGFSCIAGQSAPVRYLLSALIFPVGVAWLILLWALSKVLPKRKRWDGSKVLSCCGAFLQVGFSTMSATSLAPMMCYKHPNGKRSLLKHPSVLCGSEDHQLMLIMGWLLLTIFVLGFVALCSYAVTQVPTWSARRKDHLVAAVRFLVFRFRLDSWWFGVPLLVRGPLLSMPVVLATDYPPVQIMVITAVMATFLVMQMLAWPWKVPMLNLTDCVITFCITLMVTTSSMFLPAVEGSMMAFAHGVSTAMLSGIGIAMGIMCIMTASALVYRGAMGGKKELRMFNLGRVTDSEKLAGKLKELTDVLQQMEQPELAKKISDLAIFDMTKITAVITLLATEVAPPAESAVTYKFSKRINSSSFDPSLRQPKRSLRSTRSSGSGSAEMANQVSDPMEGNEPEGSGRKSEIYTSDWI